MFLISLFKFVFVFWLSLTGVALSNGHLTDDNGFDLHCIDIVNFNQSYYLLYES